jgi:hypothetical protein
MGTISASFTNAAKNSSRACSETYLLNFGRRSTSSNSSIVDCDASKRPDTVAKSKARRGIDRGNMTALTTTPVSNTVLGSIVMEQ